MADSAWMSPGPVLLPPIAPDGCEAAAGGLRLKAEVVIVGAGPGGGSLARALAEGGADVLVLEEGPARSRCRQGKPMRLQQRARRVRQPLRAARPRHPAAGAQQVMQPHAQLAGQMSIATPCMPQPAHLRLLPAPHIRCRLGIVPIGHAQQRLQRMRHIAIGQAEVAVPALRAHARQAFVDQQLQVGRHRRRAHARMRGQFACREQAAIEQPGQHACPRRVGNRGGDPGQARFRTHRGTCSRSFKP